MLLILQVRVNYVKFSLNCVIGVKCTCSSMVIFQCIKPKPESTVKFSSNCEWVLTYSISNTCILLVIFSAHQARVKCVKV